MKPLEAAARFAAFNWYTDNRTAPDAVVQAEAKHFAQENWDAFLPVANEGWGKLLLRIRKEESPLQRRPISKHRRKQAALVTV